MPTKGGPSSICLQKHEMPIILEGQARAKVNLFLEVLTKRRRCGYHAIRSLVAFVHPYTAHSCDLLSVSASTYPSLHVRGRYAAFLKTQPVEHNLVWKAMLAMRAHAARNAPHVSMTLTKNLPLAAGLGGGSADAALTLRLLNVFWRLGFPSGYLRRIGLKLGMDVPICVDAAPATVWGRGEFLQTGVRLPRLAILVAWPMAQRATQTAYAELARPESASQRIVPVFWPAPVTTHDSLLRYLRQRTNSFQETAMARISGLASLFAAMRADRTASLVRLSGSGPACFALYSGLAAAMRARQKLVRLGFGTLCGFIGGKK